MNLLRVKIVISVRCDQKSAATSSNNGRTAARVLIYLSGHTSDRFATSSIFRCWVGRWLRRDKIQKKRVEFTTRTPDTVVQHTDSRCSSHTAPSKSGHILKKAHRSCEPVSWMFLVAVIRLFVDCHLSMETFFGQDGRYNCYVYCSVLYWGCFCIKPLAFRFHLQFTPCSTIQLIK